MDLQNDPECKRVEIRKIQALTGERSLTLVFPKQFARELGIVKGDFLKCCVEGNRLILEKMIPVMKPFDDRLPKKRNIKPCNIEEYEENESLGHAFEDYI